MTKLTIKSEDFYDLAQCYRHMRISDASNVVDVYNEIIDHVDAKLADTFDEGKRQGELDAESKFSELLLGTRYMDQPDGGSPSIFEQLSRMVADLKQKAAEAYEQGKNENNTEIARLTQCLKKANEQAEHFERLWYLQGFELEKLKDAAAAEWQDIETAPKDGTRIEFKNIDNCLHDFGYWSAYDDGGEWSTELGNGDMTHWRAMLPKEQTPYCWTWDVFVGNGKWRAEYAWKKPDGKVTNLQPLYTALPKETTE
jgi:hypothetical protein